MTIVSPRPGTTVLVWDHSGSITVYLGRADDMMTLRRSLLYINNNYTRHVQSCHDVCIHRFGLDKDERGRDKDTEPFSQILLDYDLLWIERGLPQVQSDFPLVEPGILKIKDGCI